MTKDCYLNKYFRITCDYTYNPPQPFLFNSNINVTSISLEGQLNVLKSIAFKCYSEKKCVEEKEPIFTSVQFTVNSTINKFVAVGCDTTAFLQGRRNGIRYTTGCLSFCDYESDVANGTCAGGGCGNTSIPEKLSNFTLRVNSFYHHSYVEDFNNCGYAFVVEEGQFNFSLDTLHKLSSTTKLSLVLDWAIGEENETCESATRNRSSYASRENTTCIDNERSYWGYRCFCKKGYQGNPYLGCQGTHIFSSCLHSVIWFYSSLN